MSPELETLDQLTGGDMPLSTIRQLHPDRPSFESGILGLLSGGDVRLIDGSHDVPQWQWREAIRTYNDRLALSITPQGAGRVS
ncbi:MAG TPA: hypothetical protein VGI81_00515 [Tepidisphaeraceae bacterium]|jgi:hypothetical protein